MLVETKFYTDGTSATGVAPLPDLSPEQQASAEAVERERVDGLEAVEKGDVG